MYHTVAGRSFYIFYHINLPSVIACLPEPWPHLLSRPTMATRQEANILEVLFCRAGSAGPFCLATCHQVFLPFIAWMDGIVANKSTYLDRRKRRYVFAWFVGYSIVKKIVSALSTNIVVSSMLWYHIIVSDNFCAAGCCLETSRGCRELWLLPSPWTFGSSSYMDPDHLQLFQMEDVLEQLSDKSWR
jgi:hypothetical protein